MMEHVVVVDVADPSLLQADGLNTISIPGMYSTPRAEGCMIPGSVQYVPVPPGTEPDLEWVVNSVGNTGWSRSVSLASTPVLVGTGLETEEVFSAAVFPAEHPPVSFRVIQLLGTTVAEVSVSPFCYGNPDMYASSITYSLSWPETPGGRPLTGTLLEALCPDSEVWWRHRERSPDSPFWGKPWASIGVNRTGFYSVTGEELETSGCSVTGVPSGSLAMFSGPAEMFDIDLPSDEHSLYSVSISVFDGGDGVFDASDSLVFYGRDLWHWNFTADSLYRSYHRYDKSNTYWLTWGGSDGERISQVSAVPAGGTVIEEGIAAFGFEQEVFWQPDEIRTGWVSGLLSGTAPSYYYLSVPSGSEEATVRLCMLHNSSAIHQVTAELDGTIILDTLTRDTVGHREMEYFTIPDVSFVSGGNLLKVWNADTNSAYFDYSEVLFPMNLTVSAGSRVVLQDYTPGIHSLRFGSVFLNSAVFDISDPFHPVQFTDWALDGSEALLSVELQGDLSVLTAVNPVNYSKVESISSSGPGRIIGMAEPADVIVAVPESMISGLSVLESVYAERGLTLFVVTYSEIYDEFGQGVSDPGAVRSLVRWALDTWPDPPEALLLIGDASTDPLGYLTGYVSLAPAYVTLGNGDDCLESYFTSVHGDTIVAEIPVSRIPASTIDELLIASEKAATMQDSSILGPWANTVMLAADDEWNEYTFTDAGSTDDCEHIAGQIIPPWVNTFKLYEIEYPWPSGTTVSGVHPAKPDATGDFIDQLNRGVLYTSFYGHGSYNQMTMEKLFVSADVGQLTNAPRYFLFNSFSCDNGYFDLPSGDCLAEALLFHPGGGAAATVASTRGSFASNNLPFSVELVERLHQGDFTIAQAVWLSQLAHPVINSLRFPVLGDGGITLPRVYHEGYYAVPDDTLNRGNVNTVTVSLGEESSFFFRCCESADSVTYVSPLSSECSIDFLRYGSELYSGVVATDINGEASVEFFVPLQADTGSMARVDATGRIGAQLRTAFAWPVDLIDRGSYSDDLQGPDIELSFPSASGEDIPSVYQNAVLHAVLSDSSGICVLGNDAGSIIICSVDGQYEDVTDLFSYDRGSYTTGSLEYTIPDLLAGVHDVKIVARDGMKNTGEAVISFNVLQGDQPMLEDTGVYPNPARGERAFFFTVSDVGTVEVCVYTVAGKPVWRGEKSVAGGTGQIVWNGLDSDGDSPAAGVYIYLMKFSGTSGSVSENSVLVVSP